jgi:hypothetical protein
MADLVTLIARMQANGSFRDIGRNMAAQFGTANRRYIGAEILPERLVTSNAIKEDQIRYRTVIANAGTRYSPAQKKGGALVGSMTAVLAESDIAGELTAQEYDALLAIVQANDVAAMAAITNFANRAVNIPLLEWNERARWQAIVDAVVQLRGDNDYTENVSYSDPAGHRFAPAADWSDPTTDPWEDIFAGAQILIDKGYPAARIISTNNVVGILASNPNTATRVNRVTIGAGGVITAIPGMVALAEINGAMQANDLPPIEKYDLQYRTMTGTGRFLKEDVMVMIGMTDRAEQVDLGDGAIEPLDNVLGYLAVGIPAGQSGPGRKIRLESFDNKPPRVEGEGWQTSLPIIRDPEAIVVIKDIA